MGGIGVLHFASKERALLQHGKPQEAEVGRQLSSDDAEHVLPVAPEAHGIVGSLLLGQSVAVAVKSEDEVNASEVRAVGLLKEAAVAVEAVVSRDAQAEILVYVDIEVSLDLREQSGGDLTVGPHPAG